VHAQAHVVDADFFQHDRGNCMDSRISARRRND
jgi:hypothetical protein